MAGNEFVALVGDQAIALLLCLGTAMQCPVLLGGAHLLVPRLLLAGLAEIDDVGHSANPRAYFLRKASSETTSAPLVAASAVAGFFSDSAAAFFSAFGFFSETMVSGSGEA